MDLHPGAVELGFENRSAAELLECIGNPGGRLCEHRPDRPAYGERELGERGPATGQRSGRDSGQVTTQHGGAAHLGRGQVGRRRDGVGHDTHQRALAQFTTEQPAQERLFAVGGGGEHRREQLRPTRLRALPRHRAEFGEGRVDAAHGE